MNYRQSKNHSFYLKPDPSFIRNPFPQAFNFDSTPLLIRVYFVRLSRDFDHFFGFEHVFAPPFRGSHPEVLPRIIIVKILECYR